jgi:hypothetical protein
MEFEPHPYALMLPGLTDAEYRALKADIAEHGILVPVIVDQDGRVLDGVHRVRIAAELGIDVPVSRMGHMTENRKMHLAVGLNMRRRHLDADRRRELVHKLYRERYLTVREIASITGWSKTTVHRDLQPSPFEQLLAQTKAQADEWRAALDHVGDPAHRELLGSVATTLDLVHGLFGWADGQWKRHNWPPPPVQHVEFTLRLGNLAQAMGALIAVVKAAKVGEGEAERVYEASQQERRELEEWEQYWEALKPDEQEQIAGELQRNDQLMSVPGGTRKRGR